MTDLKTQIREYAAVVEREQEQITVEEVSLRCERRDGTDPVVGLSPSIERRFSVQRRWPALAAAVILLIIFGVFALVFPGDDPPPADTLPDPMDRETGYYVPSEVPEGFVLQDMSASEFNRELVYLRETSGEWLPGDGGFHVGDPFMSPAGSPEDLESYLTDIVESNPGAARVEVGGRQGVIHEAEYADGPVATTLVSLVVVDDEGGVFEILALGMGRDEVLSIGEGVERVSDEEFLGLGPNLEWEFRMTDRHDGFAYEVPDEVEAQARGLEIALGLDVFVRSSIVRPVSNEAPVVTTEDGSIVEPEERSWSSSSVSLYLDVPDDEVLPVFEALRDEPITVSPEVADEMTDRYVEEVRDGVVLSEDPYVIQAPRGPEPQFDTAALGEEMPLVPAESADVLPEMMFGGPRPGPRSRSEPLATEDRPVIVIGTATHQPSGAEPLTAILWFGEWGGVNFSETRGSGYGSGGGNFPLQRFGIIGESRSSRFAVSDLSYSVPLETAVVQFIIDEGTFWQRPTAGYGVISQKYTEDPRPTSIIAYDAEGNQIGEREVPPR
ncbi:MAG: hypothetical protein ACLFRT_04315 [Actinomycetota bacterium]